MGGLARLYILCICSSRVGAAIVDNWRLSLYLSVSLSRVCCRAILLRMAITYSALLSSFRNSMCQLIIN